MEFQEILKIIGGVSSIINLIAAMYYEFKDNQMLTIKHLVLAIGFAFFTGWV